MRLDKFISQYSDYSRSQIQIAIKRGLVTIDGICAKKGEQKLQGGEVIKWNGDVIEPIQIRYLMLNKPLGCVCANTDSEHPTVLDLIQLPHKNSLQIVGRLDIDTTGLILLTDDGQWNHRITSPRRHCPKTYRVTTADPIQADTVTLFLSGVQLHGEKSPTLPAHLELLDETHARLTIQEGKYHQVKRMFAASGNRVIELHRERIGNIKLDENIAPGEYRALTIDEITKV